MNINKIRHSLAHILAHAVQELYSEVYPVKSRKTGAAEPQFNRVKFGIGPAIENGFYYDFDFKEIKAVSSKFQAPNPEQIPTTNDQNSKQEFKLTPDDLPKIEKKMREIIRKNLEFRIKNLKVNEAKKIFQDQPYKLELIDELKEKKVKCYEAGKFIDLCKGPHVKSTKEINSEAFKLTKIAGAYWRGDEKNPMLTRIYGVAFETKKELDEYLKAASEAEKRDHRVLGQKMSLFLLDEEIGAGLPVWLPKGTLLRKLIQDYLYQELKKSGYLWLVTPHLGNLKLWKTSGHWELYRENMYSPIKIDEEEYLIKPMNCPFHVKFYKSEIRSYKNLPIKSAEFGTVYRYEKSGVLHGLVRVRGFTQDDAHIWCQPDQLDNELEKLVKQAIKIFKDFGFKDLNFYLSTRPEKYAGTEKGWQKAANSLKYVLKKLKIKYQIDPGGGVFYGPKIDIKIKDSLNREWQCTTVQVDFNLPERCDINFINKKGKKEKPYMIHRALLGSLERFIGVLIENYAGALPLWLSPEQIWLIPVGTHHEKYANFVNQQLTTNNLRTVIKDENETVSKKIREGEVQKIPYLLVVGDKEIKTKSVRVRQRGKGDIGPMKLTEFLEKLKMEIEKRV